MSPKLSPLARVVLILFRILSWRIGSAQISFVRHDISTSVDGAYGLHVVDVDGDGKLDILSAATNSGIQWRRKRGDDGFAENHIGYL
jgi:hypothetical protein